MAQFKLEIVTPQRLAYSQMVDSVYVPTPNGMIGVLPRHEALFTSLAEGEIKVEARGKDMFLAIGGGFMEVTPAGVSILVSRSVHADELNEAEIKKAHELAKDVLKNKGKGAERADAQALLKRSILELKVAGRRKRHREMQGIPE